MNVLSDESKIPNNSVDLIYLDPPFNSESKYNLPFRKKLNKDAKPVEAFKDIWQWGELEEQELNNLKADSRTKPIADIIQFARIVNGEMRPQKRISTGSYLLQMAMRLECMKRVLKERGSIYLHCDPTAGHYLKAIMDYIFGVSNFRNEIIWTYGLGGSSPRRFSEKHDVILFYTKGEDYYFDKPTQPATSARMAGDQKGMLDVWTDIPSLNNMSKERLGYPTQKPLALLERIINASSKKGDWVLDPFCGCGTSLHAAEKLERRWTGIDISSFSSGLVKERIVSNFAEKKLATEIQIVGNPIDIKGAKDLAREDPFEFEKWVCGRIGAHGMFKEPGAKGADGGVDGVIDFALFEGWEKQIDPAYALVQVKGGKVTPDSVRALSDSVRHYEAKAGILVCFEEYMVTVENNRSQDTYGDLIGTYPVIQGFSVERLLCDEKPVLPPLVIRGDARMT